MTRKEHESSLKALQDIRSIMDKSVRFISLSGWSGIWAGCIALAGSLIAYKWLKVLHVANNSPYNTAPSPILAEDYNTVAVRFILLSLAVLGIALVGGFYFTWKKTKRQGGKVWNVASRRMIAQISIPLLTGGIFVLNFLYNHQESYIAPACLTFYGLALINGSKYTLSDIKYLGLCEVALGCINLFMPAYGLAFWSLGFGALHILYGIIMWNKYDKYISPKSEQ